MRTITRMASLLLILAAGFSWVACGDEPPAPAGGGETPEEPGGGNEEPEDTLSEQEKEFLQIEFQSPTEADADNGFAATVRFTLEGEGLPRGVADWGVAVSVNRENLEKRPEQWISTLVTGKELPISNFNILTLKGLYGKETYYCRPYIQSQEGTMKWGGIARFTTPEEVFFISQKDSSSNSIMEGTATIETNASSAVLESRFQKVEAKLVDVSLDKSQFSLNYYETEPSGVNHHSLKWLSEDMLQVSFTRLPPQASVSFKVAIECDGVQKYLSPTYLVTSRELPETGMVDLGLAVHWAACNLGASSPWDTGSYMTFDEAQAADEADGSWRLPNESDIIQLTNRCQFIPVSLDNMRRGMLVVGFKNSIFLPYGDTGEDQAESSGFHTGYYWTGDEYYSTTSPTDKSRAWSLRLYGMTEQDDNRVSRVELMKKYHLNVRPVCPRD